MPKNKQHFFFQFFLCLPFLSTSVLILPTDSYAHSSVTSQIDDTPQSLPPPPSRPGMSEYKPISYEEDITESSSNNTPKGQGLPGSEPSQSPSRPYNGPSINIPSTGIRAYFNAPVPPPYNDNASYDTYAGQPGGNRNTIYQQSDDR